MIIVSGLYFDCILSSRISVGIVLIKLGDSSKSQCDDLIWLNNDNDDGDSGKVRQK